MAKTIGENALKRAVRLLKELNQSLVKHDNEEIVLRLHQDGSGALAHMTENDEGLSGEFMFNFDSPDELMSYLESGPLGQILKSRRAR